MMALWSQTVSQDYQLETSVISTRLPVACEVILPMMWDLLGTPCGIHHVLTFAGPGPFTALRAGQSFAQGLCFGDPNCSMKAISWFDLLPTHLRETSAIDTGGGLWLNHLGQRVPQPSHSAITLSTNTTTTPMDMLHWSHRLACHPWNDDAP